MIGIYFSGSGNTAYAINCFVHLIDAQAKVLSIENPQIEQAIKEEEEIVLAYPIYYSNLPKIMREFLKNHQTLFHGKKVFIIATMGLFSGDGCGCSARLLASYGANILGGLHLQMPDCIADEKALKRPYEKNLALIQHAEEKIKEGAKRYQQGNYTREGLGIWYHLAGLFGQRLWFYGKTKHYSDQLRINTDACIGCGHCASICPMQNLEIIQHTAVAKNRCTMCYRCVNACPSQAITLLGKKVMEQHTIKKYRQNT